MFLFPIITSRKNGYLNFKTDSTDDVIEVKLINRKRQVIYSASINEEHYIETIPKIVYVGLSLKPKSKVVIQELIFGFDVNKEEAINEYFNGDTLLITGGYPSYSNKYNSAFIHTRMREYKQKKMKVDLTVVNELYFDKTIKSEFEGINVFKTSYNDIRKLLQTKKYKRILIHFFNERNIQILDGTNLKDTMVYLYSHGTETLYRAWDKINRPYFINTFKIPEEVKDTFPIKDEYICRYNEMPNVKFIFVSKWQKEYSEKLNGIKYKNYEYIPCYINEKIFKYQKKDPELRKKIFVIRKFDNYNTYSIDTAVKVVAELSKRDFFDELEFSFYGDGSAHVLLTNPLREFDNVKVEKRFLTHGEISEVHKQNGIALFPTGFETQAVSAGEAASSGCVVITSKGVATSEYIKEEIGTYVDSEDIKGYADKIEYYYENEKAFLSDSKKMSESITKTAGYKQTIQKELDMFISEPKLNIKEVKKTSKEKPLMTIVIPSYNVEKYLEQGVDSLLASKHVNKLEILVVNDGSKDSTKIIGEKLEKRTTNKYGSIVKLIDKENGGHGSTINVGIRNATGKYLKLMDGDDYFVTAEFDKLLEKLERENADIILTNYIEDFSIDAFKRPKRLYDFMVVGKKYKLEDLSYPGYGFGEWGPLLSTSTFKTKMLQNADFLLDENCFYVDMELNLFSYMASETVTYYPYDIYNYYLGRDGQSVSVESYKRNWKHHETVTLRLLKEYHSNIDNLSKNKKRYIKRMLLLPMIKAQYYTVIDRFEDNKQFLSFEKEFIKYPEFYNNKEIVGKQIKFHRKTKGVFIKYSELINRVAAKFKRS